MVIGLSKPPQVNKVLELNPHPYHRYIIYLLTSANPICKRCFQYSFLFVHWQMITVVGTFYSDLAENRA